MGIMVTPVTVYFEMATTRKTSSKDYQGEPVNRENFERY